MLGINYENTKENNYTKISGMEYKGSQGRQRVINWWFTGPFLNGEPNKEWNCYQNCNMVFKNNVQGGEVLFVSKMPTQNGCNSWYNIPREYDSKFNNIKSFCVQIVCGDGKESEIKCWKNN